MNETRDRIAERSVWAVLVVLGALLALWARQTDGVVRLPAVESRWGWAVVGLASVFLAGGLMRRAPGGVHRLMPGPIHIGFAGMAVGLSLVLGSASGLWLVSPVVIAGAAAVAWGSRRARRGGGPLIRIAPDDEGRPDVWAKLSVFPLVFIPWTLAYKAVTAMGVPHGAVVSYLPMERRWGVVRWTELIYFTPYVLVTISPLLARTNRQLRRFELSGLLATGVVTFIFVTVPLIAPAKAFDHSGVLGWMLEAERAVDEVEGTACFPSFHVIWSCIGATLLAELWPRWRALIWAWAVAVSVSCVTTGMHSVVDIVAGFAIFPLFAEPGRIMRAVSGWRASMMRWGGWRGEGGSVVIGAAVVLGAMALVAVRMWSAGAMPAMVCGYAMILAGLGWLAVVPNAAGERGGVVRMEAWKAMALIAAGVVLTCLH